MTEKLSFKKKIYQWARGNRFIKSIYGLAKKSFNDLKEGTVPEINTFIIEITPFIPRKGLYSKKRMNLILPSIKREHMFGGISTALEIFKVITEQGAYDSRIIVTDASAKQSDLEDLFNKYSLVEASAQSNAEFQLLPFSDRFAETIPVSPLDYFLATAWWTAYFAQRTARWQAETYRQPLKKIIYLVQDYEPGFYPWSSQYVLAESTYRYAGPQIAIFNTLHLKDYFNQKGYSFEHEYCFQPVLNKKLKEGLETFKNLPKKRQILIYGRPSVPRNGFTLIIEALRLWVWKQPQVEQWQLVSAGETHQDIELGKGMTLKSLGKMSLEQYAKTLAESAVGLSLMISPHPSYPPLEMASYGLQVITNCFANKELANSVGTINSLKDLTPESITAELVKACQKAEAAMEDSQALVYNRDNKLGNLAPLYRADEKTQFNFIEDLLKHL